jgi:transposase-like protein
MDIFLPAVILLGLCWYLAYPLRTRHIEELMEEHVVNVDHSTTNRWIIKYSLQVEEEAHWRIGYAWLRIDADPQP